MDDDKLLQTLETSHLWIAESILKLRELEKNKDKFTEQAINEMRNEILQNIQLNISEMEILSLELGSDL